jgi:hypothetical protein
MEISHKKLKIALTVPDVFMGQHYISYFDVMEETADRYKGSKFYIRAYLAGLAVCTTAIWEGQDLKALGLDVVPMRVIKWVADQTTEYINRETEVPEA